MSGNEIENLTQRSQNILDQKFTIERRRTFFESKRGSNTKELFLDAVLKITGKITNHVSRESGYYLFTVSASNENGNVNKEVCIPIDCLDDQKFINGLNIEFGSGDFRFGGEVKKRDKVDYFIWLKEEYYASGEARTYKMANFIGYHRPEHHWVLSNNLQLSHSQIIPQDQQAYYVHRDSLADFQLQLDPSLINDFPFFKNIFSRIINCSSYFKENELGFLVAMGFMVKSYLNIYNIDRTDAGETRFMMFFSNGMSNGKSTSMRILANGQGVVDSSSRWFMSGGDGCKTGTTTKPMKEVFQKTNLFVFLNDYQSNKTIDELLLQSHEGFSQGSSSSGIQSARASAMLTGNGKESLRLSGRVLKINFVRSPEFTSSDKDNMETLKRLTESNTGYIIAWCHHFGSLWYNDECINMINVIDNLISSKCPDQQSRVYRGWASAIMGYVMLMYSLNKPVDLLRVVQYAVESIRVEIKSRFKSIQILIDQIIPEIEKDPSKAQTWLKVDVKFSNDNNEVISSIAVSSPKIMTFPNVLSKELNTELTSNFGQNSVNTIDFKSEDGKDKVRAKAYKLPECKFASKKQIETIYKAVGKKFEKNMTFDIINVVATDIIVLAALAIQLKTSVTNLVREKEGHPVAASQPSSFMNNELTPRSRTYFSSIPPNDRKIFVTGYRACRRIDMTRQQEEEEEDVYGEEQPES